METIVHGAPGMNNGRFEGERQFVDNGLERIGEVMTGELLTLATVESPIGTALVVCDSEGRLRARQ
jgi:hypothetical protein